MFSLVFYSWGEPKFVSLLLFSALANYLLGLLVEKYRGVWQSKAVIVATVVINLSLLGFFKYSMFIVDNINHLITLSLPYYQYGLPIGISFYTFQSLSYVVDVYRGEVEAQKSPFKFLLYVSMFHQLVAGPIVRYQDIAEQIDNRVITMSGFSDGIYRFITGLIKKVFFANTAGEISGFFLDGNMSELSVLGAWFGITLFAIQIYFDFSGYSDMAIGLGKMFGFTYKENFNYPYISKSASEFWRRWHISLGSFFRDYVYIPLGGNRSNHFRNMFVVWFLTGLWHGASWNFILWGLYFGVLIMIERKGLLAILDKLPKFVSHAYLIVAALVGWVFFYYTDLSQVFRFLEIMFGFSNHQMISTDLIIHFNNNVVFFVLALISCTPFIKLINKLDVKGGIWLYKGYAKPLVYFSLFMISTVLLVGKTYNPFLYFRF